MAFAVDIVLSEVIVTYSARLSVSVVRDYGLAIIVSILLLILLLRQQMWVPEGEPSRKPRWRFLRLLIAFALLILLIMGAFGYVILARYAMTQLVLTGGLLFSAYLVRRLGREFINNILSEKTRIGEWIQGSLRMDESGASRFEFWLGLAYDAIVVLISMVVGLFIWGADSKDVADWVYQALFGFQIGQITFSLFDLFVAILLFVGLVMATRFVQRLLAERFLPHTQLDSGIQ